MARVRLLASAIGIALVTSVAAHAGTTDFNQIVVFGDSLSDDGNLSLALGASEPSRFTTNPGTVAVENIAAHYGLVLTPSVTGGNDYAFGGAGINHNASAGPIPLIGQQLDTYLAANGGHADAHTLYSMWGGANDIFYATSGAVPITDIPALAGAAATSEVKLLNKLNAAGGRYVVVFNLPDIGKTPQGRAAGAAASASLGQVSLLYNGILAAGIGQLSQQGMNVVPVDVYSLFNEVIADPSTFGFSNVTQAACGAGSTSLECGPQGSGAPYTYAPGTDESYLFADGVHPTTAAHAMLAQYVIAELNAPGQVSLLGEAPMASADAHLGILRNQMRIDNSGGTTRAFVGVHYTRQRLDTTGDSPRADSNNVNLAIGVDAAVSDQLNLGVALGVGRENADVHGDAGGYRLDSIIGSGYASWHAGGAFVGANAGFAQLNYKNIDRRFSVGALRRTESGETDGNQIFGGLDGGWWFGSGGMRTGPFARIQWQRIHVSGYTEAGSDSSAMWFDHQLRTALIGTLGWQFQGSWQVGDATVEPYANLAWNHDDRAESRTVRAGLSGMPGSFALTGFVPDANWGSVDLGVTANLTDTISTWAAYRGRFSDSRQRRNGFEIGFKVVF
jgi:outer membrane lipase/esterase